MTDLDAQSEIYSAWKEWNILENNLKYLSAFNAIGGEPTVAGQRLDVTYFLINGWKLKPQPGSYDLNIIGNLFDVDGGSIKVPADTTDKFPNNISISTNTSVIVRQVDSSGGVSAEISGSIYNIEGVVLDIQNTLSTPITATLDSAQSLQLTVDFSPS